MTNIQQTKTPMPLLLENLEPRQTDRIQGGLVICRKAGGDQQE